MKNFGKMVLAALFLAAAALPANAMMPAVTKDAPGFVSEETAAGRAKLCYPKLTEGTALLRFRINGAVAGDVARFQKRIAMHEDASGWTQWFVGCADDDAVSILLPESTYYDRAAHPTTHVRCLNFDGKGNVISRADILKKVETNPDEMKNKIFEQTKARDIPIFDSSVLQLTEWPEEWYIGTDRTIYFIFQQYEIAPYSSGWIEIAAGRY